jgi:membrane protein YqaA with SNARE-associated domain
MPIAGVVLATLVVSAVGGLVPIVNVELWLVGVSATCPSAEVLPVALAASLGQVVAKAMLYGAGRAAVPGLQDRVPRLAGMVRKLEGQGLRSAAVVFGSALAGVPPLYAVSVVAGVARFRFTSFVALTLAGRLLRFLVVFGLPRAAFLYPSP